MVSYKEGHLVIDLDVSEWDPPRECRSQLMNALISYLEAADPDRLNGNRIEQWWLCRLLTAMVDEE